MLKTSDRQKINFQLDGITIDTWKKFDISTQDNSTTLMQHSKCNHNLLLACRPSLSQYFSVIFVEEPPFDMLDICEDK